MNLVLPASFVRNVHLLDIIPKLVLIVKLEALGVVGLSQKVHNVKSLLKLLVLNFADYLLVQNLFQCRLDLAAVRI